jgi:tetratricopeptide (TPR) repeat protein
LPETPKGVAPPAIPEPRRTEERNAVAPQRLLLSLREAAVYASNNQLDQANLIYAGLLDAPNPPREMIAAAGTGLYRTGDYSDAVEAFRRLGPFARGEEDLRYYNAVSLFETGQYLAAKKELDCALPYIQVTDDVARYSAAIDRMAALQRAR